MNNIFILLFLTFSFVAAPALAEKPDWSGKGKPSVEQKKAHKSAMEAKESIEDDLEEEKEKKLKKQHEELKGLEKQKAKKIVNSL